MILDDKKLEFENKVHERFADILLREINKTLFIEKEVEINQIHDILCRLSQSAALGSSCLDLDTKELDILINHHSQLPWLAIDNQTPENAIVLMVGKRLYLKKYYQSERSIEDKLKEFASQVHKLNEEAIKQQLHPVKYMQKEESKEVVLNCLRQNLSVITGGPGTGKTTIVVRVLALLIDQYYQEHNDYPDIEVLAPTGKASARVKESIVDEKSEWLKDLSGFDLPTIQAIPETAQTVHKFLAINLTNGKTKYIRGKKANVDILIVDEASMLDIILMTKLLDALKPSTHLILLGDPYQLASVEAGNVLAQIIESSQLAKNVWLEKCCTMLTESYRFDKNSGIGLLAKATNKGDFSSALSLLNDSERSDIKRINKEEVLETAINGYNPYKSTINELKKLETINDEDKQRAFDTFDKWQVFSPYRSNFVGVAWLNSEIEKGMKLGEADTTYFGKPIIIRANDHSLKLNNGDIGICLDKDSQTICFPIINKDGVLTYRDINTRVLPEHELVYAMTVHKSQGSEYKSCFLYVPEPNENQKALLTREIFYTALTRAKKSFLLSADDKEIQTMITTPTKRSSGLLE